MLCDCDNETDVHLFKDCNFARAPSVFKFLGNLF